MQRKLKVFQAQFGFFDSIVAASSQAAALRAWGTHRNLFADGEAHVVTDEAAIAAASAHPDIPLRRGAGTDDPFSLTPRLPRLPDLPDLPAREAQRPRPARVAKPPPDRTALDAAERALAAVDEDQKRTIDIFDKRRADLDAEQRDSEQRIVAAREQAEAALQRARTAFRKAGGRPDPT